MFKDICNPLGIPLVGFLAANRFDILGMRQNDIAGWLQDVVDRNPILSGRFHTHIFAVVFTKPDGTPTQISCEGGKSLAFIGGYSVVVG